MPGILSRPVYGAKTDQGHRRTQEDRGLAFLCYLRYKGSEEGTLIGIYGVFDGHGGFQVAQHLQKNFQCYFLKVATCVEDIPQAVKRALRLCEKSLPRKVRKSVGSTAVVAVVTDKMTMVFNVGDSRAILARDRQVIEMSNDHKPTRDDERERIENAGGQIHFWFGCARVDGLAMTRAVGDFYAKRHVISTPEVMQETRVPGDDFLVLASDGIWDVMSNQEVINLAYETIQGTMAQGATKQQAFIVAARDITNKAFENGSRDNITVLVVDLRQ